MARHIVFYTLFVIFLGAFISAVYFHYLSSKTVAGKYDYQFIPIPSSLGTKIRESLINQAIMEEVHKQSNPGERVSSLSIEDKIDSVAVLLPSWEVLVVASPRNQVVLRPADDFQCQFPNNETAAAEFVGVLPFSKTTAFKCVLPKGNRRRLPFRQPVLKRYLDGAPPNSPTPELLRWSFLVYDSFSTESDVVLFVKGVNNRQGVNRSANEFRCVFGDGDSNAAVKTAVTSSVQEVFRCRHPNLSALSGTHIKVSLEISGQNRKVPSVAYYTPPLTIASPKAKSQICACTMVYNSAKFLREWVLYHSKIGVGKFILYDNGSSDESQEIIDELNREGYNVEKVLWIWPKTQEAGFSHGAIYAKDSCAWMMYLDVDEFIFSPSWLNSSNPSKEMLNSLLRKSPNITSIGQIRIKSNEFGPSGRVSHPPEGVTQGYTCRRRGEQRHKSLVRLEAVDHSLLNVIHHFELDWRRYRSVELGMDVAVVNHYKYQAWPEFKNKFRRRVSAYVVDWTQAVNPNSQDRTPGLGFEAVEPQGWAQKFCEVVDERLKILTQRWFGSRTGRE